MKNKRPLRLLAVICALVLSVTTFSTVAYAGGGDYHDSELPPAENTEPEEITPPEDETEPVTITPGTPFTEDGIAATRDLLYDEHTTSSTSPLKPETATLSICFLYSARHRGKAH